MRRLIITALTIGLLALPAGAAAGGRPFVTALTGAAEIPGPGDPDGSGTAVITLNSGTGEVCWFIQVEDILVPGTVAHIHVINPATGFGPPVVDLTAPGGDGTSSGCTIADPALVKTIRKSPENYYVNTHNSDYPAGALRGDLG